MGIKYWLTSEMTRKLAVTSFKEVNGFFSSLQESEARSFDLMGMLCKSGKTPRFVATKSLRSKGIQRVISLCENPPRATPELVKLMSRVKMSKNAAA